MLGEAGGYPISQPLQPVDANGRFSGRIAVPTAVAATVAGQARTVRISRSSIPELARAAQNAAEEQVPVVSFTGELLADGEIPPAQGGGLDGPSAEQLAGVHDPGRVEPLLDRAQRLEAELADLRLHVGGVIAADGVVVGDRAARGDDRLAGGRLDRPPLLDLLAAAARR